MHKKYKKGEEEMINLIKLSRNKLLQFFRDFLKEEDGIGVVEVILILVVLIGLVIIFKDQLTSIVNSIFSKITSESSGI